MFAGTEIARLRMSQRMFGYQKHGPDRIVLPLPLRMNEAMRCRHRAASEGEAAGNGIETELGESGGDGGDAQQDGLKEVRRGRAETVAQTGRAAETGLAGEIDAHVDGAN